MKTYKAGELREDMLVVPVHKLEGFVLVPVEPTPEMLAAIVREADKQESYWAYKPEQFYRAMLAAAPKGDSHE